MTIPERDGDGYLIDMNIWSPELGKAMAEVDGIQLDDVKWQQIIKAREYYEEFSVVPPIRKFGGTTNTQVCQICRCGPEGYVQDMDDRPDEADYQIRWFAQTHGLRLSPISKGY